MTDLVVGREYPAMGDAESTYVGTLGRASAILPALPAIEVVSPPRSTDAAPPRRDSNHRRTLAFCDALALVLAYWAVWIATPPPKLFADDLLIIVAVPLWIALNKVLRLYDRDASLIHKSTLNEFPAIVQSISIGTALTFIFSPLLTMVMIDRVQIITFWLSAIALTTTGRWIARSALRRHSPPERILIVGAGEVSRMVARKIQAHKEYGAEVVGYVDMPHDGDGEVVAFPPGIQRIGEVEEFADVCGRHGIERVVVGFSALDHTELLNLISVSKRLQLKISVVPRLFEVIGHGVDIDQVEGMTLLGLRGLNRTRSTLFLKRAMDVAGASAMLLLAAPLLLATAVAIKMTSPGPILYAQRRVGRGSRDFKMYKFRTMVQGADAMKGALVHLNEVDEPMFKIRDDPRVTRVGRLLRRTSLDELPQLWNVLRGEMSLVGPRPLIPEESNEIIGRHRARLDLTPGLTGPWQVMGRNSIPFHEMIKLDFLYVSEWSMWNDIKLLVRTLPVVLARNGH